MEISYETYTFNRTVGNGRNGSMNSCDWHSPLWRGPDSYEGNRPETDPTSCLFDRHNNE